MVSPHKALFGREPFMKIPSITSKTSQSDLILQANDSLARTRMKTQADKRPHRHQALQIGDKVLIRNDKSGKLVPTFNPSPGTVIAVKGTQVTVIRDGKTYIRNESFLKKIVCAPTPTVKKPPVRKPLVNPTLNTPIRAPIVPIYPQPVNRNPQRIVAPEQNDNVQIALPNVPNPVPPVQDRPRRIKQRPAYLEQYVT
jgi:hypothetical protein